MEINIIQRLQDLANLQSIDSNLDRIRSIRGGLPEEVSDLEDEIAGIQMRLERLENELKGYKHEISDRKVSIDVARDTKARYESQLQGARNSREYGTLVDEINTKELEIESDQIKINKLNAIADAKQIEVDITAEKLQTRSNDLGVKNAELGVLIAETKIEEDELLKHSAEAQKLIEPRLLKAYTRIRKSMRNGLAVVMMDRGACGGCFAVIPPQRICDIGTRKKMIICENCGRILVDKSYFGIEDPESLTATS